jgi:hypothetical protein
LLFDFPPLTDELVEKIPPFSIRVRFKKYGDNSHLPVVVNRVEVLKMHFSVILFALLGVFTWHNNFSVRKKPPIWKTLTVAVQRFRNGTLK